MRNITAFYQGEVDSASVASGKRRVAVIFDTPYPASWGPEEHWARLELEIARWKTHEPEMEYQIADSLRKKGHEVCLVGMTNNLSTTLGQLETFKPDMVFNSTEGFNGDPDLDHLVTSLLDAHRHKYTGAGTMGLLLTRNKAVTKQVLLGSGIRVPRYKSIRKGEPTSRGDLSFPLIVKPLDHDASVGIAKASVVSTDEQLEERVAFIHQSLGDALIEEFVDGRELYAGFLGNGKELEGLPITEMTFDKTKLKPEERIATKNAKWDEGYREKNGIKNVFARPLSSAARERLDATCREAFRALYLRDYCRFDLRLTADDEVWLIEANANPFISYGHDMAMAAEKAGLAYADFIERIVRIAEGRYA